MPAYARRERTRLLYGYLRDAIRSIRTLANAHAQPAICNCVAAESCSSQMGTDHLDTAIGTASPRKAAVKRKARRR